MHCHETELNLKAQKYMPPTTNKDVGNARKVKPGPVVIYFFSCSAKCGILDAHKYKNIKKLSFYHGSDKPRMLFFLLKNVKLPTIVGILTFMSRKNLMLRLVEHEIFRTSGTVFLLLDEGEPESVYNRLGILYSEPSL